LCSIANPLEATPYTLRPLRGGDPFNDDIETGNMTACRCTHRVEYTGIVTGGEVTGGHGGEWNDAVQAAWE